MAFRWTNMLVVLAGITAAPVAAALVESVPLGTSCGGGAIGANQCVFFCNAGDRVSVSLVGVGVVTASCGGATAQCNGTSLSTPVVCGKTSAERATRDDAGTCIASSGYISYNCSA